MKSRTQELLDKAISAMVAAIEIYNKPGFPYRNESFTILAINGWELLLKAKWLQLNNNKITSLYVYEKQKTKGGQTGKKWIIKKTRSKTPFTHSVEYLARQLVNDNHLDSAIHGNLDILLEFRDSAVHFYNSTPEFTLRLYEVGAACVKNFSATVHSWFNRELSEFNLHLMPLSFLELPSTTVSSLVNLNEKNFLSFVEYIDNPESDPESPYSVTVNVEMRFTKSKSKQALQTTLDYNNPEAIPIQMTEEDILQKYPWSYDDLTMRCKGRFVDFKVNNEYHSVRKSLAEDDRFAKTRYLDPKNSNGIKRVFLTRTFLPN